MSESLWPHGLQHTRLPCPLPSPLFKLMSIDSVMPSNYPALFCPFLLLPLIFPASGYFLMSQFFASGGQSIGVSASVLSMNIQDCFPLALTGLISLKSKSLLQHQSSKASILQHSFLYGPTLTFIHDYQKIHSFDYMDLIGKVMSLLFNMLSLS